MQFLREMAALQVGGRQQPRTQLEPIGDVDRIAEFSGSAVDFDRRREELDLDERAAVRAVPLRPHPISRRPLDRRRCYVGIRLRDQLIDRQREKLGLAVAIAADRLVVDHQNTAAAGFGNPQRRRIRLEEPLVALGDGGQSLEIAAPLRKQRRQRESGQAQQGDEAPL